MPNDKSTVRYVIDLLKILIHIASESIPEKPLLPRITLIAIPGMSDMSPVPTP
jgi:hypothetical protein